MFKRLAAVALMYATRRLLWLWAFFYLAVLVLTVSLLATGTAERRTNPQLANAVSVTRDSAAAIRSRKEVEQAIADGRQDQVETLICQSGWMEYSTVFATQKLGEKGVATLLKEISRQQPLPEFDRFPALRVLDLTDRVLLPADAERLSRCESLEWLSLERTVIVNDDLSFLAGLKHLDTLVWQTTFSIRGDTLKPALPPLPELRTFVIGFPQTGEMREALSSLRGSPRLCDLVIKLPPSGKLDDPTVAMIRSLPSLERLFVGGYSEDAAGFRRLCAALPKIRVWHAQWPIRRFGGTAVSLFAALLLVGFMQQVQATFAVPQARLLPRFRPPHYLAPLTIVGMGIAAQTGVACFAGAHCAAALALQLFMFGLFVSLDRCNALLPRTVPWPWRRRESAHEEQADVRNAGIPTSSLPGILVVAALVGSVVLAFQRPYVLESYLLGELPGLTWGGVVIGIALFVFGWALIPQACVRMAEEGIGPMLSFKDMERQQQNLQYQKFRGWQRRLERLPPRPNPPTWFWLCRAFRSGSTITMFSLLRLAMFPFVIIVVTPYYLPVLASGRPIPPGGSIGGGLFLVGFMFMAFSLLSLWQRRKAFQGELLYPWSRRQMVLAVFGAHAWDVATISASLVAVALVWSRWTGWTVPLGTFLAGAAAVVALAWVLAAGTMWTLTLRHGMLVILVAMVGGYALALIIAISAILIVGEKTAQDQPAAALLVAALESAVIAPLLAVAAYRRWMRMEWGMIPPS